MGGMAVSNSIKKKTGKVKERITIILLVVLLIVAWLCSLVEVTTLVSYRHPFTAGEIFAWVTANGYEVGDISSYCMRYVWPYWVLCTIIYAGLGWLVLRMDKTGKVLVGLISLSLVLPLLILPVRTNLLRESFYVYQQIQAIEQHQNDNESFTYNAMKSNSVAAKEVYVFAIGESVRYKNISINGKYERETTPLLKEQQNLILYSDYYANATLTQHAMPMLLTPAVSITFMEHFRYKSIAAAFRESGFKTALVSHRAQLMNNGYHGYLAKDFDTTIFVAHDSLIAPILAELADKENKLFVVTNYLGNHMFYTNRTEDCLVWRPDYNADTKSNSDSLFLNAYDNSLLYTDKVLNNEIETLKQIEGICAWFFVSDHGEYISSRVSGHGHTYQPTKDEYHVPLMVWYNEEYAEAYPNKVANVKHHKDEPVCADHVFWSVLDMADIQLGENSNEYSLFMDKLNQAERTLLLPDGKSIITLD